MPGEVPRVATEGFWGTLGRFCGTVVLSQETVKCKREATETCYDARETWWGGMEKRLGTWGRITGDRHRNRGALRVINWPLGWV